MEIKYCPICMQELIKQGYNNYVCKLCKMAIYIVIEYSIDSPYWVKESGNE